VPNRIFMAPLTRTRAGEEHLANALMAEQLNAFNLAYLHLMRGDFFQQQTGDVMTPARVAYRGVLIGNMGYSPAEAEAAVARASSMRWPSAPPFSPIRTCPPASAPGRRSMRRIWRPSIRRGRRATRTTRRWLAESSPARPNSGGLS
jgi:hypothetical protein